MEATNVAVEVTTEINDDQLLIELEKLSDAELAQIGGGQGIVVL